jgi:hypothetical protein
VSGETQGLLRRDSDDAARIGGAMFALLGDRTWIRRRSEQVEFHGYDTLRMSSTLDIVLPAAAMDRLELDAPNPTPPPERRQRRLVVPLDLLEKGPLVHFDLTLDGRAASLLNSREIAVLTASMLLYVAVDADESSGGFEGFDLLEKIGGIDPGASKAALAELAGALGEGSPKLLAEAGKYVDNYLLIAEVATEDRHMIIKYGRDRPLGTTLSSRERQGREDTTLTVPVASSGFGGSYHVEVVVPPELKIMKAHVEDGDRSATCGPCDRASLYLTPQPTLRRTPAPERSEPPTLTVLVVTHRSVLLLPAAIIATISAIALIGGGALAWAETLGDGVSGSAGSAVFLAPSIAAGLVLYRAEAPLVRVMLAQLRLILAAVAGAAFIGGALLAFGVRDRPLGISWVALGATAALGAGILTLAAAVAASDRSPPPDNSDVG